MKKTYGEIYHSPKARVWVLKLEPHVALRLKRNFPKVRANAAAYQALSDTPEHCLDLHWFMLRYPLEISPNDRKRLEGNAWVHKERQTVFEQLLAGLRTAELADLALPLREYQKLAAALALSVQRLLIADDVGVGKSATAIGMIVDPRCRPALVVTMTHLPLQWQREIGKFAPSLRTHILNGTKPYAFASGKKPMPDVVLTSYSKLRYWGEHLAIFNSVVFDEIQELRKHDSQKYVAAQQISHHAAYCVGLTATPIYNQGSEIHSIAEIIRPDALGTLAEFKREWCNDESLDADGKGDVKDPKALGVHLRDIAFMIRRTRKDVGRELPAFQRIPTVIEADTEALEQVSESCRELARFLTGERKDSPIAGGARVQKLQAAEQLSNQLRQATGIAKAPHVADFVRILVESGEKVLLFGWHRAVYQIWLERLKDLKPKLFTGSESANEKEKSRLAFCEFDSKVLIMSLRAGAGIDGLQHVCRTCVFGELDWSYGVHVQDEGRIARDGQQHPVTAYYPNSETGADPIMLDVLNVKAEQLVGINDPTTGAVEQLQADPERIRMLAQHYLKQIREKVGIRSV